MRISDWSSDVCFSDLFDGEINPTERSWLDYDSLGHFVLCLLDRSEKWKSYVKKYHPNDLLRIAATGSWMALQMIGQQSAPNQPTDEEQASRYFGGNTSLFQDLRKAYSNRPKKLGRAPCRESVCKYV